jgi:hypothetical protein
MLMAVMVGLGVWRLGSIGDATDDMTRVALKKERDSCNGTPPSRKTGCAPWR